MVGLAYSPFDENGPGADSAPFSRWLSSYAFAAVRCVHAPGEMTPLWRFERRRTFRNRAKRLYFMLLRSTFRAARY